MAKNKNNKTPSALLFIGGGLILFGLIQLDIIPSGLTPLIVGIALVIIGIVKYIVSKTKSESNETIGSYSEQDEQ